MKELVLRQVSPKELTQDDVRWLVLGAKASHDGATATDQVAAVLAGNAMMFRFEKAVDGMIVLQFLDDECTITCLAGRGVIENFDKCHNAVQAIAKKLGARKLLGYVTRPGLDRVYQRKTNARRATFFMEDLDVQQA